MKKRPNSIGRSADTWIQTFTGRQFWPLAPQVAEHSLHVAAILPATWAPWGLLRDAYHHWPAERP